MHPTSPYLFWLCAQCLAFPLWALVCGSIILLASGLEGLSETHWLYIYNLALTNDKKHLLQIFSFYSLVFNAHLPEIIFSNIRDSSDICCGVRT